MHIYWNSLKCKQLIPVATARQKRTYRAEMNFCDILDADGGENEKLNGKFL